MTDNLYEIETLDPHTTGSITDSNGQHIEDIAFDFYSEDAQEWETLADAALAEAGYRRVTDWVNNTAFITKLHD